MNQVKNDMNGNVNVSAFAEVGALDLKFPEEITLRFRTVKTCL